MNKIILISIIIFQAQVFAQEDTFLNMMYIDANVNIKGEDNLNDFKNRFSLNLKSSKISIYGNVFTIISLFDQEGSINVLSSHSIPWHKDLTEITLVLDELSERAFRIYGFNGNDILDLVNLIKRRCEKHGVKFKLKEFLNNLSTESRDVYCNYKYSIKGDKSRKCTLSYSDPVFLTPPSKD